MSVAANWLNSLSNDHRELVFAEMRRIRERISSFEREAKRLQPPYGTIGVGAADFDPRVRADSLSTLLREIGRGKTPDEAMELAKQDARVAVSKHNAKRPNQIDWGRWEGTADSVIEHAWRNLRTAIQKAATGGGQ